MPGARLFPDATLNDAEHAFTAAPDPGTVAVHGRSQTRADVTLLFTDVQRQVAASRAALVGLGRGDRVAGYLPNVPEALVAFLATASLGAV